MKEQYDGYENRLFKEDDQTGEEEEMPPFQGRTRGGCVKCQTTCSLKLAVQVLYGFFAFIVITLAVLASLVFRKLDNLNEEELLYNKQIAKVQENMGDLSSVKNCTECHNPAQFRDALSRLKKEFKDIQKMVQSQGQILNQASESQNKLSQSNGRMMRDVQTFGLTIQHLNQSLEQYLSQVNGWQAVITETDQGTKTLIQDQNDLKATMQQVNMTVVLNAERIGALQRKSEEEALLLQKMTKDWQNYSSTLSALKSNSSANVQTMRSIQSGISATNQRISMSSEMVHDVTLQVLHLQMQLDNLSSFIDEHEENMHDHEYHFKYYQNRTGERFLTLDTRMNSMEQEIDIIASSINATVIHVQSMYKYINMESSSCQTKLSTQTEHLSSLNSSVLFLLDVADSLKAQYTLMSVRLEYDVRNLSMVMEEMKLVDTRHSQLIQNFTILKGVPGPSGPKGYKGETGSIGPKGNLGIKGDRGINGLPGRIGPKGLMGAKGDQGEAGVTGVRGTTGYKGAKGSIGVPGPRGEKGQKGDMGVPGRDGLPGPKGPAGIQGQAGLPGAHGIPGPKGKPGPVGPRGLRGPPGPPGNSTSG